MQMIQHEHVTVELQGFMFLTITERVRQDLPAVKAIEQIIPTGNRQRDIVGAGV